MDVHDRGMLYYRLLKYNVKEAQRVVCGQTKMVAEENTVISRVGRTHHHDSLLSPSVFHLCPTRPFPHQLSLFPEFNTLSVMYSKHSPDFITQKCPYVLGSDSSQAGAGLLVAFCSIFLINYTVVVPFSMQRRTLTFQWRPPARLPQAATPHFPLR